MAKKKIRKKRGLVGMFFKIVVSIVLVFIILSVGIVFAYNYVTGGSDGESRGNKILSILDGSKKEEEEPLELNVAVFGVDKDETRTDVIFVVHFDSATGKTGLLSVPRDTRVYLSDDVKELLDENKRSYPNYCKMNEVHSYGGKKDEIGSKAAVLQLEDLLGVEIDHYAKVNIEGFKSIVDAIGGVYVNVPQNMYYSDPVQGLYINLKEGYQLLDGDKAEQLVRYRSYRNGDVDRVSVQQIFLKEFAKKVLSTDTILKNITDYITVAFKYLKTDVSISDALKYVKYIKDISFDNIYMETLPGAGQYVGEVSYYLHDTEATLETVNRILRGIGLGEDEAPNSKNYNIEISNGGDTKGLAGKKQDMLNDEGYNVISVSTYEGERTPNTRIIVSEEGKGEDLLSYFTDAEIITDSSQLKEGVEILIILGTEQE